MLVSKLVPYPTPRHCNSPPCLMGRYGPRLRSDAAGMGICRPLATSTGSDVDVWDLVVGCDSRECNLHARLAEAAGRSGLDAIAKLSWLQSVYKNQFLNPQAYRNGHGCGGSPRSGCIRQPAGHPVAAQACFALLGVNTLAELWEKDDIKLFEWLDVLSAALRNEHLAVADWLVDEAECPVLRRVQQQQQMQRHWDLLQLWDGAARGGSAESMRWLLGHRVPVCQEAMAAAVRSGRLEAMQFLHEEYGVTLQQ